MPPTGKLFRASVLTNVAGETCVNVLHLTGQTEAGTAATCFNAIQSAWVESVDPVLGDGVQWIGASIVEITRAPTQDSYENNLSTPAPGPIIDAPEAPQLAVCCNIKTGLSGRTRRGRFFLAGIPDADVKQGRIQPASQARLNTMIAALTAAFLGDGATSEFQLGVFSRSRYAILSNPFDEYWVPATSLGYNLVMSTMRSRKPAS